MKINHKACALLLATVLLGGCSGTAAGTVTGTNPGTAGSGTAGSTTTTTTTGSGSTGATTTTTTVGAGVGAAVGAGANVSLANIYAVGKKWTYNMTAAGISGTMGWEVTDVSNGKATVKTTSSFAGQTNSNTTVIDFAAKNPYAAAASNGSASTGDANVTTSTESVTVPAGTFNCTKVHSVSTANGFTTTVDVWYDGTVGLVKQMTSSSVSAQASSTLELASHS